MSLPMIYAYWDDGETADTILGSGCLSEYPWWVDVEGYEENIGKSFTITYCDPDHPSDPHESMTITWARLRTIARNMAMGKIEIAERIVKDIKRDDLDADSADCILQWAVFGEIRYG